MLGPTLPDLIHNRVKALNGIFLDVVLSIIYYAIDYNLSVLRG
jgi:hypothetical protein